MNGVIWNKMRKTFVPIFSMPVYAAIRRDRFKQSRALEIHNFQQQNLTLSSFQVLQASIQELNFLEFYDNDTKVSGLCGDLWTLLSDSLNFTLQPMRANVDSLGMPDENLKYKDGLLGLISRNETDVIPKVETYRTRLAAVDFTMPLWMNSYRFYTHYEVIHDNSWMIKIFSWKLWCIVLIMYVLLSIGSFWSQRLLARMEDKCQNTSLFEHFFYNFGMLCCQSYIPEFFKGRSKILEASLGFFSFLMYTAFSTLLFTYIAKRVFIPPFDTLDSLVTNTKYNIINLKGSIGDIAFKISFADYSFALAERTKRTVAVSTVEEMFKMTCSSMKQKYALFQGEDEYKAREKSMCHLIPTGKSYLNMWVASGIVKNFKYKRTIDLGILRLKEVGLWDALMERWLKTELRKISPNSDDNALEAIKMDQVALIIAIMCCGAITALIILIIENVVFFYKFKKS